MTAKNVYDLHRGLLGLYPLTTKFHDTTIKLFDIQQASKPSSEINPEDDAPGNQSIVINYSCMIQCGTKLIPRIETLLNPQFIPRKKIIYLTM